MSAKRMLGITVFGVIFIAAVIGVMLFTFFWGYDSDTVQLPETVESAQPPGNAGNAPSNSVEVTTDNVQAVIATIPRPETYSRDVMIESFWNGGRAVYNISATVTGGAASLKSLQPGGVEKNIIIMPDKLYIWENGDRMPHIGSSGSQGDWRKEADEWQMLVTYEDVLALDKAGIIDAGYAEYGNEYCIYVEHRSKHLGNTIKYYISVDYGLVTGAEQYDETGMIIYSMTAGACLIGEADMSAFELPDGSSVSFS